MNILFTGPSALVNEWIAVCDEHHCFVYSRDAKKHLSKNATHVQALDDADEADLILNLHVAPTDKRKELLAELVGATKNHIPVLCNSVAVTATEIASWTGKPERIVGLAALPTLLAAETVEIAYPFGSERRHHEAIAEFFTSIGKRAEVVADEVGLVFPRLLCMIINEAVLALQQGVASEDAIETSMTLAVNYPKGPLAWGKAIGWKHVHAVVHALHSSLGDDRYRPAPLLRRMALVD